MSCAGWHNRISYIISEVLRELAAFCYISQASVNTSSTQEKDKETNTSEAIGAWWWWWWWWKGCSCAQINFERMCWSAVSFPSLVLEDIRNHIFDLGCLNKTTASWLLILLKADQNLLDSSELYYHCTHTKVGVALESIPVPTDHGCPSIFQLFNTGSFTHLAADIHHSSRLIVIWLKLPGNALRRSWANTRISGAFHCINTRKPCISYYFIRRLGKTGYSLKTYPVTLSTERLLVLANAKQDLVRGWQGVKGRQALHFLLDWWSLQACQIRAIYPSAAMGNSTDAKVKAAPEQPSLPRRVCSWLSRSKYMRALRGLSPLSCHTEPGTSLKLSK